MSYHKEIILNTTTDETSEAIAISHLEKMLIVAKVSGTANCIVEARQEGASWIELERFVTDGELNIENFGWHDIRAKTTGTDSANVTVTLSWR